MTFHIGTLKVVIIVAVIVVVVVVIVAVFVIIIMIIYIISVEEWTRRGRLVKCKMKSTKTYEGKQKITEESQEY